MTVATAQRAARRYGFPFKGVVSSVDRHEVPLNAIGPDSREVLIEPGRVPELGKVKRRHGSASLGVNTGVLEMASIEATMRGLELFEMPTLFSGDGFPVPAAIFADESRRYGQLWLYDGTTSYTEGEEFGPTHYTTAPSTPNNIKMPPLPYDGNGATGYTRMAFEEARRHTIAGTRRRAGIKNHEFFGGFFSTPSNFNREYNLAPAAGSNNLCHYPTGHIMPLWAPDVPTASYPAKHAATGPWQEGDQFFLSIAFEYDDGSVSMPFIPRDKNSVLTGGLGLVTVLDAGTSQFYDYLPYRNLAIGGPGVRKRRLYRSNKVTKGSNQWPSIATLKLCAIIEDNTSTSYNDPLGNDGALFADPLLRTDQVWQQRSRYDFSFDQRHAAGYIRPGACAIVIAPTSAPGGTSRGVNPTFDATPGATAFLVQLIQDVAGAMSLRIRSTAFGVAVPVNQTIALVGGVKVQDVVDTICATTAAASPGGEWVAQVVPGANANAESINLAPTHVDIPNCSRTNGSPTLTASGVGFAVFADVAEGMKVNDAAFPIGTYVKKKNSSTSLTMSANATATAGPTPCEFYADSGDDALFTDGTAHSQFGNLRAYGNSVPVIIGFKQSYLDTFPTEKRDVMITTGGPTQKPNAAHMFHTSPGGRFQAESDAGIFMGGAPLHSGALLAYSRRSGYYRNLRSGSTGEDQDYRNDWVDMEHGCRSPYSFVHGNGWVGMWRDDGFWIFDGDKSAIITNDIFDPVTGKGDLAYEAVQCDAAAAADTNDYAMHATYSQGRLWLNFRTEAGTFATMCYDASTSIEASGIAQMLDPDGNPFGWSSRCTYNWRSLPEGTSGAMGAVQKSDGVHLYQVDDKNDRTNCGLAQEFETVSNFLDGTDNVMWQIYTTTDMAGGLKKFGVNGQLTLMFRNAVAAGDSTVFVSIFRNQQRTGGSILNLPLTAADFFTRKVMNPGMNARTPSEVVELWIHNDFFATQDDLFELSGIEVPVDLLDSLN